VVIGISEDEAGAESCGSSRRSTRSTIPIVMMTPELEKLFPGISALPTSFILDRESRIVQKHVGMLTARPPSTRRAPSPACRSTRRSKKSIRPRAASSITTRS
jgi:hypothetical protein